MGKLMRAKSELQIMQERTAYLQKMIAQGYVFFSIIELEELRPVMSVGLMQRIASAILKGEDKVPLKPAQYLAMRNKLQAHKENQQRLERCATLNNEGRTCEQYGDIIGAIAAYEANIELGYPAHHAFKRLLVLYRKSKDYKNELRVAQRACRVFPKDESYKTRRDKVKELLKKLSSKS